MGGKVFHKIGLGTEGLGLSGHIYYQMLFSVAVKRYL